MKKYTFYTSKKIVGLFLVSQILSAMITIILALFSKYTSGAVIYGLIVGLGYVAIFLHQTAAILSTDNNCLQKGFIFKKNIYWNNITQLRTKEQYLTIFEDSKTCIINLNILKVNPDKYKSFFNDIKENISDEVHLDVRSKELLDGKNITTPIDYPLYKLGGWLLYIYVMICASLLFNVLGISNSLFALFMGRDCLIYSINFFTSILTVIMTVVVLVPLTKRKHSAIKFMKIYYWVLVFNTVALKITNLIGKNINFAYLTISIIGSLVGSVLMAFIITEYLNTSVRVKNTLVDNPIQNPKSNKTKLVDNSKKRITILFFGEVDSENATNWYNEIKQQLQIDNIKISKVMASPDKLLDGYNKYYDLDSREQAYLKSINDKASDIELCELGFSCGDNNTSTPCYGDMSWGKLIYKEGMSLSFSYSTAQNVTIEKYIDIYKKYIDWHWIHMYEIDHMYEVSVKRVKGHMVEHSRSKKVLNDWKR